MTFIVKKAEVNGRTPMAVWHVSSVLFSSVLFSIVLFFVTFPVRPAHSEPVRVSVTGGRSGEGWLYGDGRQCFVLTPRHVLLVDGTLARPMLVDASGMQGAGLDPEVPPSAVTVAGTIMDVAKVRVVGALAQHCSDDLGYDDLDATLDRIIGSDVQLYFEKVDENGSSEQVPVEIIAVSKDHERFTIRTKDPDSDEIRESDSGSIIRLRGTNLSEIGLPLGLVLNTNKGYTTVLRLDAIRKWLDAVPSVADSSADLVSSRLSDWSGQTPDPRCGPANLFDPAAPCGWRPLPPPGQSYVGLDLVAASGHPEWVKGVAVDLEARSSLTSLEILIPDVEHGAWQSIRFCAFTAGNRTQTCSFLPRQTLSVRVRIGGLKGGVSKVRLLEEASPEGETR